MSKNRHKNEKPQYNDKQLLKAMNELEATLRKSDDELLDQDPEGGLSTEGEPLSKKAPKGKGGDVAKSDDNSDEGSDDGSDDEDTTKKGGDMDSDDESEGDDESDDSGDGDDDESDDESPPMPPKKGGKMGKSLRERADDDETLQKAVEVSDFLEALIDQSSETLQDVAKALLEDNQMIRKRLQKSETYQRDFNARLANGLIAMGRAQQETFNLIKSVFDKPNVRMNKSVLNSGDIIDPHRRGDDEPSAIPPGKIAEWLFQKAMRGEIDQLAVVQFETNPDINALPSDIRKALINDLQK